MANNTIRLLTPGPTPLPENVRLSLARDMIHHRKDEFKAIMGRCQENLRHLFGTSQEVLTLTSSGTGAMDAAVTNLFQAGDRVAVVDGGKFGERWLELARNYQLEPVRIAAPWGQAVTIDQVRDVLADTTIKGLLVQASETSTGVRHPIQKIGELTATSDCLLVVDGISALGISPCPMDKWHIDCLLTGSQKGLMLPPGLAFLALSERAWEKAEKNPCPYYFNLVAERRQCRMGQSLFTPAINLIVALETSLQEFAGPNLQAVYQKQWALTQMVRAGVTSIGLPLLAPTDYTWGLTSVCLPQGIDGGKLLKIASERYGVYFAGGQGELKNRAVRIGHMGHVDWGDMLAGLYALYSSFTACGGHSGARDYQESAMRAYETALENWEEAI